MHYTLHDPIQILTPVVSVGVLVAFQLYYRDDVLYARYPKGNLKPGTHFLGELQLNDSSFLQLGH